MISVAIQQPVPKHIIWYQTEHMENYQNNKNLHNIEHTLSQMHEDENYSFMFFSHLQWEH